MTAPTSRERLLAAQVTLTVDHINAATTCPAWVESKGSKCLKPATTGMLCKRHHTVAERRLVIAVKKRQEQELKAAKKATEAAPRKRARLAELEARIAALNAKAGTPPEMAAVGGDIHRSIARKRDAAMDQTVALGVELTRLHREADRLRNDLERTTP